MRTALLFVALCAVSPGCSDRAPTSRLTSGLDPDDPAAFTCAGAVTGQVRFANGVHAAAGALVYAVAPGTEAPRTGQCGQCLEPAGVVAYRTTGVDGRFELPLPPGAYDLVVSKGLFERRVPVDVACEPIALDGPAVALPRSPEDGRFPRIAVIQGHYDSLESVLVRLGVGRSGFIDVDRYEGQTFEGAISEETTRLLREPAAIDEYAYLFINCGSELETPHALGGPSLLDEVAVRKNLRRWVAAGGRLYVTDQSYDFVEQLFPERVDFAGDESHGGAEWNGAAEIGTELPRAEADVLDDTLRDWLDVHGMLGDDGTVPILHLSAGWAVMDGADAATTRSWLSAPVQGHDRPLTVTFQHGCGAVLFSSYHTAGPGAGFTVLPQEAILGYLAFEIGSCVAHPVLY